jgi:vitamin B12 transporter
LLLAVAGAVAAPVAADQPRPSSDSESPDLVRAFADQIVVTATRAETAADEVGSAGTVITRAQLDALRQPTLLEALRLVPGLEIAQAGGPGRTAGAFLRGASTAQTLVLLDGVRLNDPNTGAFDFADLRTDEVERIEILRGPQSTLYGSEAMGGVINIITRRGRDRTSGEAVAEVGSLEAGRLRVSASGASRRFDWRLGGGRERTDEAWAADPDRDNPERDPAERTSFDGVFGAELPGGGRAELSLRAADARAALDGFTYGVGPTDDPNWRQRRRIVVGGVRVDLPVTDRWRQSLRLGATDEELRGDDPDTPYNVFAVDGRVAELTLQSDVSLSRDDVLIVGYTRRDDRGRNPGNYDERLTTDSLFLDNRWAWRERLFVTAGVRLDDHSTFGRETSYRVTAAAKLAGARLHGSAGTGFRAPSLVDLYFPYYGNPGLQPETSTGWDLGAAVTLAGGRVEADLTVFGNRFDNLIAFDYATFLAANIASARSRGAELSVDVLAADALRLAATYSFTDSEDLATGASLPRRPRHRATIAGTFQPGGPWRGALTVVAVRDRLDAGGVTLPDYVRVDGTLEVRVSGWARAYLRLANLFDADIEEVAGYWSPGFAATLGFALDF